MFHIFLLGVVVERPLSHPEDPSSNPARIFFKNWGQTSLLKSQSEKKQKFAAKFACRKFARLDKTAQLRPQTEHAVDQNEL